MINSRFKKIVPERRPVFGEDIWGDDLAYFKALYGRSETHLDEHQRQVAIDYHTLANMHQQWFECDCRGPIPVKPLVGTNKRGFVTLVDRAENRTPHSPECTFSRNRQQQTNYVASYRKPELNESFVIHRPFRAAVTSRRRDIPTVPREVSRSTKPTSLQRLLWLLIQEAGLNVAQMGSLYSSEVNSQARMVEAVSKRMLRPDPLRPEREIPLSEVCCFSPASYTSFAMALKETSFATSKIDGQETTRAWPNGMRPQGFVIGVVERVEGRHLHFHRVNRAIEVEGRISIFGENPEEAHRAPYLAILSLTKLSSARDWIGVHDAYLHPILDETYWMPMDSNYERHTYRCLTKAVYAQNSNGRLLKITKPLFDLNPSNEESREVLLPDFLITLLGQGDIERATWIVETMGYPDDWYHSDKDRMHGLMRQARLGLDVLKYAGYQRPDEEDAASEWEYAWRRETLLPPINQFVQRNG